jgi:hypothetical protein
MMRPTSAAAHREAQLTTEVRSKERSRQRQAKERQQKNGEDAPQ